MSFRKEKPTPNSFLEESIDKAYQYYREGKIDDQLKVIRKLVEVYSRKKINNTLLPFGQISALKRLISVIKNQTPEEYPEAQLIHAMFLARDGRVDEAIAKYRKIHAQYPDYIDAYFKHKMLVLSINAKDGSVKELDKAIFKLMKANKKKEKKVSEERNNVFALDQFDADDTIDPLMALYEKLVSPKKWFSTIVDDQEKLEDSKVEVASTVSTRSFRSTPSLIPVYGRESPLPKVENKPVFLSPIQYSCYTLFGPNPGSDKLVEIMKGFNKFRQ